MANVQPIVEAFKSRITEAQQIAEIRAATFIAKHTALMSVCYCARRWMSRYECAKRILNQWKVLQDFFHQAALEEKCYTARQLDCIY